MKFLSKKQALARLEKLKDSYRNKIRTEFKPKAKNCLTCETQGVCCTDAHFVNVHITKIEAEAINENLQRFDAAKRFEIYSRIEKTIEKYNLKDSGDTFAQTFACPLFEKGIGCLIHSVKPVPCIQHACYKRREDLPPDELQIETEAKIEKLNEQTYGKSANWLPLPVWIQKIKKRQ